MRSKNFVDEDVSNVLGKLPSPDNKEDLFPEHTFIATCLRIGLGIEDLKKMTYVDVLKILIGYINENITEKKPTQAQIKMLTG